MIEQQKYYFVDNEELVGPHAPDELLNFQLYFTTPIVRVGSNERIPLKDCKELMALHKANRNKFPPIIRKEYSGKSNDGSNSVLKIALLVFGLIILLLKIMIRMR